MSAELLQMLPGFASAFLRGLGTNLSIAAYSLLLGLPIGSLLGALCLPAASPDDGRFFRRWGARMATGVIALLRAAPTFVVMVVLFHAVPARWALSGEGAVALALAGYVAAYVADNMVVTVLDARAGARGGQVLFLKGLARAYLVVVLSSGFGAALGVVEATTVTLRALEQLSATSDRLWLIGGVVLAFIALRQCVQGAINGLGRQLERRLNV
ncbi:MAG: hypothetical protein ABW220_02390 [Burkholderiaceae bacterium]